MSIQSTWCERLFHIKQTETDVLGLHIQIANHNVIKCSMRMLQLDRDDNTCTYVTILAC